MTAGIEKLVPTTAHAFALLRLLVRSATGGELTQYTTFHCGPKRPGDADGPEEMHIVLVDNGRSRMLADEFREMLRCIRCGACMNHCVVYRQIGGHAYGGVYPGPMGAVLTPVLAGLATSRDLPFACTMNGRCAEVCPVDIPLPTLLRAWRGRSWREGLEPRATRYGIGLWASVARRPRLYRLASGIGVRMLRLIGRGGWIGSLPFAGAWTTHRDFPTPAGRTFMDLYRADRAAIRRAAGAPAMSARDAHPLRRPRRPRHAPPGPCHDRGRGGRVARRSRRDPPAAFRPDAGRGLRDAGDRARDHRSTGSRTSPTLPAAVGRYLAEHGLARGGRRRSRRPSSPGSTGATSAPTPRSPPTRPSRWVSPDGASRKRGSLVIHSGPDTPILLAFLPLHHIVVLPTRRSSPTWRTTRRRGGERRAAQRGPDHRPERHDRHRGQLRERGSRSGVSACGLRRGHALR